MSVTVVALPISIQILAGIAPIIIAGVTTAITSVGADIDKHITKSFDEKYSIENLPNIYDKDCEVKYITEEKLLENAFETPFMSKEILIKTLEEHGVTNVKEEYIGKITGQLSSYNFTFTRQNENEAYKVVISHFENDNAEEKINDLNDEYNLNVQEESYLSIVEKLKENSMEIENEEVLDDNTIVLTINLE